MQLDILYSATHYSLILPNYVTVSFDSPWQTEFMREVASTGNSNKLVPTCIEETQEMLHAVIFNKDKIPSNKQVRSLLSLTQSEPILPAFE